MIPLPIDDVLPRITGALARSVAAIVQAPPGAGKTTRVPPALLDAGIAGERQIVMLQPRRIAARTAAHRMAAERRTRLGGEVGYQVRFDRQASSETRIVVVTEGILTRWLRADPFLDAVGVVILDEFHERRLETDLALGMVRRVQQTVRPDLKLLVMSATLDAEPIAAWLGGCPIVESQGRCFPVRIEHLALESLPLVERVRNGVEQALRETTGDLLVFLPGVGEIRQCRRALQPIADQSGAVLRELFGDLSASEQDAALLPGPVRRIVLSTNVAETSVTIEGVTAVIDSGLARVMHFDSHTGLDRLRLQPISRASADQRAGRAGRVGPGLCLRLWSEASQRARAEQETPEIRRVDLAGTLLTLRCWGEPNLHDFPWFEPPTDSAIRRAERLLRELNALNDDGPTPLGQRMADLPVHPRLARLMLAGQELGVAAETALAAAILSERDPLRREEPATGGFRSTRLATSPSDLLDRMTLLREYERGGQERASIGGLNPAAARTILKARDQLLRNLPKLTGRFSEKTNDSTARGDAVLQAVWMAYRDRLCRRREPGGARGVMVGGRGIVLDSCSAVRDAEFFVALDVDGGQGEARVRMASAVDPSWIDASDLTTTVDLDFDAAAERVSARRRVRFRTLILEESPAAVPNGEEAARLLADAAVKAWDRVYPPEDGDVPVFVERVNCLRSWMPELNFPEFDVGKLQALVSEIAFGCRSFAELRRADWLSVLRSQLTAAQWNALEREAPERITVPSGSRISLHYETGRPPVLAVKIQEVFGWKETPRIAGGRVRVLLHLLAPNQRPQQVTDDLASFWANGYPVVRKELRARYPKHPWPENPQEATAQRGTRRNS